MKSHSFKHNFHDGHLASFTLGPRRELTLNISLDPVWNKGAPPSTEVRFGGIENFEEVSSFFRALPAPPIPEAYIAGVIGLQYSEDEQYWVVVNLEQHGQIRVQSHHVTES